LVVFTFVGCEVLETVTLGKHLSKGCHVQLAVS